jgi:hypothetical protein
MAPVLSFSLGEPKEVSMFLQKWDDWLITHIFEPIALWSEYRTGIGGIRIHLYLYMTVFTVLGVDAYYRGHYTLIAIDMLIVFFRIESFSTLESTLKRNKGLNEDREYWVLRTLTCGLMLLLPVMHHLTGSKFLADANIAYIMLWVLVAAFYFGACNGLPPGYEERKLAPRTI